MVLKLNSVQLGHEAWADFGNIYVFEYMYVSVSIVSKINKAFISGDRFF